MNMTHYFVDRESGQTIRIEKVDERYASVTVIKQLPSTWMMPVEMYDTIFVMRYLPLDVGQMAMPPLFRMPANASYWEEEHTREAEASEPVGYHEPTDDWSPRLTRGADRSAAG